MIKRAWFLFSFVLFVLFVVINEQEMQGRRIAAQPGAHDVRHRVDHRPAEPVRHGHGAGGLAAEGHRGDRGTAAPGLGEGGSGPAGQVASFPALSVTTMYMNQLNNAIDRVMFGEKTAEVALAEVRVHVQKELDRA